MLPGDLVFDLTGVGTGNLTFTNGDETQLFTAIRPGGITDIQEIYTGWIFQPSGTTLPSIIPDNDWVISWLELNGAIYGLQAAVENGSSDDPRSIDFAIVSATPLTVDQQEDVMALAIPSLESVRTVPSFGQ